MEILNIIYEQPGIASVLVMTGAWCLGIGLVIGFVALIEGYKKTSFFLFALAIVGVIMLYQATNIESSVVTYEVILTDMTYNELIENYKVIDTKGKILVVQEKDK